MPPHSFCHGFDTDFVELLTFLDYFNCNTQISLLIYNQNNNNNLEI